MSDSEPLPTEAPILRVPATPQDVNALGDIFGGWLISQADIAGSIVAHVRAKGRVVTVAVNHFQFIRPVFVGDLVSYYGRIVKIGTTSIRIGLDIFVERLSGEHIHSEKVAESEITYVAIDGERKPRPIPAQAPSPD